MITVVRRPPYARTPHAANHTSVQFSKGSTTSRQSHARHSAGRPSGRTTRPRAARRGGGLWPGSLEIGLAFPQSDPRLRGTAVVAGGHQRIGGARFACGQLRWTPTTYSSGSARQSSRKLTPSRGRPGKGPQLRRAVVAAEGPSLGVMASGGSPVSQKTVTSGFFGRTGLRRYTTDCRILLLHTGPALQQSARLAKG
jgi:hypothetical protein